MGTKRPINYAYHAIGGHAAVRCSRIEDLELARRVKQARLRMLLMIATQSLGVAMYASLGDACEGFRKNLYALLGNSDGDFFLISSVFAS